MAGGNLATVRRSIEVLNRGEFTEDDRDLITDDFLMIPLRAAFGSEGFRGEAGLQAFFADNRENFDLFELSYDDVREVGDRVIALGRVRVRGKASGAEVTQVSAVVWDFRDGRICRAQDFGDPERALRAVGLA